MLNLLTKNIIATTVNYINGILRFSTYTAPFKLFKLLYDIGCGDKEIFRHRYKIFE